jgi:hypothetical protein
VFMTKGKNESVAATQCRENTAISAISIIPWAPSRAIAADAAGGLSEVTVTHSSSSNVSGASTMNTYINSLGQQVVSGPIADISVDSVSRCALIAANGVMAYARLPYMV